MLRDPEEVKWRENRGSKNHSVFRLDITAQDKKNHNFSQFSTNDSAQFKLISMLIVWHIKQWKVRYRKMAPEGDAHLPQTKSACLSATTAWKREEKKQTKKPISCLWSHAWLTNTSRVINRESQKKLKMNPFYALERAKLSYSNVTIWNPNQGLFTEHTAQRQKQMKVLREICSSGGKLQINQRLLMHFKCHIIQNPLVAIGLRHHTRY